MGVRKLVASLVVFLFCAQSLYSQDLSAFEKRNYTSSIGQVLPYRILYPENYNKEKKYPVILFLHGAGERGNDNEKQLTHGARLFLTEENRKNFQAIVIFPQCTAESYWSSVVIDRNKSPYAFDFDYTRDETEPLKNAIALVKKIATEEGGDKKRIYITGLSMGGMGTFEAVYRYPTLFAAATPICGGGDVAHYDKRVRKIPFSIYHGDSDIVVGVNESRQMVEKLKSLKANVRYKEYPGVNHNSWDNAFAEPDYLSWMFSHRK
jgi:predicted peptidase